MTLLPLFFSPCPNDTFCFHAMVFGLVDTEGLSFEPLLEDVEQLNQRALNENPAICKISYHTFLQVFDRYRMLPCGSALGFGNGPLLVAQKPHLSITTESRIAIPGAHTTAALLLKMAYPQAVNIRPILFSDISDAILQDRCDAGVLIHEGRFVYEQQGLHLITDLGARWEARTGLPIPLGGIAVSRNVSDEIQQKVARILHRSIRYAQAHPSHSLKYVQHHARELDAKVIRSHIEMFVNDYTLHLGATGSRAVEALFQIALQPKGHSNSSCADLFVPLMV